MSVPSLGGPSWSCAAEYCSPTLRTRPCTCLLTTLTPLLDVTQGLARSIGVSNYGVKHLEELMKTSDIVPAVNQVCVQR